MDKQIVFRHMNPKPETLSKLEDQVGQRLAKFERFRPSGILHIELTPDADHLICNCHGQFGHKHVDVHADGPTIMQATLNALKRLEHCLSKEHDKQVTGRRHMRAQDRGKLTRNTRETPMKEFVEYANPPIQLTEEEEVLQIR